LWRIVDAGCREPPLDASPTDPGSVLKAGLQCDLAQGYALLKDRCGETHYLVLPTARRIGIESPELLRADEPRYLALAWAQRGRSLGRVGAAGGLELDNLGDVGLAVNSRYGRSQAQLHVHIDFLRPEVRAALAALPRPVDPGTSVELMGHHYRVDPLDTLTGNPFARAASAWNAQTQEERARLTLALVGDGDKGYYLLSDRADLAALDRGHAEELLRERHCR
jgi:CDP-diacylglycerol pyrophosphatase